MSATEPPVAPLPEGADLRHLTVRVLELGAFVALLIGAISTLPALADLRTRFASAEPGWLGVALLVELASCASFIVAFRGVYCPRLPWRLSADISLSEQAANVLLPTGGAGGLALGAWALQRGGMPTEHIGRRSVAFFLITSSTNFAVAVVAGMLLALGILPGADSLALALVPAGLALVTFGVVICLPRVLPAREIVPAGRVRRPLALASRALAGGIHDVVGLLRAPRPSVILGVAGYMAFDMAALAAAFHAFGPAPALGSFLLAYVIGQLGGLIPLPGGVGGTDGGLIAAFALYGTPVASATAAVLAYRAFQLGLPALLGSAAFADLRRVLASADAPAALCAPLAEPPALPTVTVRLPEAAMRGR